MLLTITTTHRPARDLGFLLHKNPDRPQSFDLAFGRAHVFYPEAGDERCTAALLLEIDPVGLVRGRKGLGGDSHSFEQYVNDRPYVASSFLSVAIASVFGNALGGRSKERPELAATPIPLEIRLAALPCRGGEPFLRKLFEPLGYSIQATGRLLDDSFPEWGASRNLSVTLTATKTLSDALTHLYVLIPVMDNAKHYWVGDDEVEKLLKHGDGWLSAHPEREEIVRRYLKHRSNLAREATQRLVAEEQPDSEAADDAKVREEEALEQPISLNDQRLGAVLGVVRSLRPSSVIDLGCGEGRLVRALFEEKSIDKVSAADVSYRTLEITRDRLKWDRLTERQKARLNLFQASLTYRDPRFSGHDVATLVEVIEHLDVSRLAAMERVIFEFARPGAVVVTSPNAEYNVKFERLPAGKFRHRDHRFEWTRAQFQAWAGAIGGRFGYTIRYIPVGPEDPVVGAPTQMGVFSR